MREGTVIDGKYTILKLLSEGATATTALALAEGPAATFPGTKVILKALPLKASVDWKNVDLFKREIDVLKALDHPSVPKLFDSFEWKDDSGTLNMVLVTEFFEGNNLRDIVASGKRFTEDEAIALFLKILGVVAYIHSVRPPVIHRDINPKNVMLKPDGSVALVDFSGVQDAVRLASAMGQTMVGTPGYTPLEQFTGKASTRSDLYACAATCLNLLTHLDPQDLPTSGMKIDVARAVPMRRELGTVLSNWIDPDESKRTMTIADAIDRLSGKVGAGRDGEREPDFGPDYDDAPAIEVTGGRRPKKSGSSKSYENATLPSDSKVTIHEADDVVIFTIPQKVNIGVMATLGGFAVFWIGFVAFWTAMTLVMGAWYMSIFSIPFWVAGGFMIKQILSAAARTVTITVTRDSLLYQQKIFSANKSYSYPLNDIGDCVPNDSTMKVNGTAFEQCMIEAGTKKLTFGTGLSARERGVLAAGLNRAVQKWKV